MSPRSRRRTPSATLAFVALLVTQGCAPQQGNTDGGSDGQDGSAEDGGGIPSFDIPADFQVTKEDTGVTPLPEDTGIPLPQDTGITPPPEDTGNPSPQDTGDPFPQDTGVTPPTDTGNAPRDTGTVPRDTGAATDTGPAMGCGTATSCGACTPMASCGWCAATGRCMTGSSTGPTGTTCASGWAWVGSSCPADPCARHTSCGPCSDAAGCGWCRSSRRCMSGTSTGPMQQIGTCGATDWAWLRNQCTALSDPCGTASGCVSCRARANCGWCNDSDTCHTGTSSGPTDGSCPGSQWRWTAVLFCL